MPANQPYTHILNQFGLPTEDQRRQQMRNTFAQTNLQEQNLSAGQRVGSAVGRAFANKRAMARGTPETRAVKSAGEQLQKHEEGLNASGVSLTPAERETAYKQFLAEAAANEGLADLSVQISSSIAGDKAASEAAALEREKLLTDIDYKRALTEKARNPQGDDGKRFKVDNVWPVGSENPNDSVSALVDKKTGEATYVDNATGQKVSLAPGEWTGHAPRAPEATGRPKLDDYNIGANEAKSVRQQFDATAGVLRQQLALNDLISENMEAMDSATPTVLGTAGATTKAISKIARTADALAAQFLGPEDKLEPYTLTGGGFLGRSDFSLDGSPSSFRRYVRENEGFFDELLSDRTSLTAEQRAELSSRIVALGYARARQTEPGGRSITDADFKNHLKTIGGDAESRESFLRASFATGRESIDSMELGLKKYDPAILPEIINDRAMADYEKLRNRWIETFPEPNRNPGTTFTVGGQQYSQVEDIPGWYELTPEERVELRTLLGL